MNGKIFVIGSMNMDMTVESSRMPAMGETITGGNFVTAHGGKGANQAVAAARLGGKVGMCACIGRDSFGNELKSSLDDEGIDTSFVLECGEATGVAVITIINSDNTIIVARGANACVSRKQAEEFLKDAKPGDILLVQLETDFDTVEFALSLAKEKGMTTVVNPAPADANAMRMCRYADIIIPNETELSVMTGTGDVEEGLLRMKEAGARIPAATLGSKGCAVYIDGRTEYIPSPKVAAVDTTGAGDTFCGALCASISNGLELMDGFRFAVKAASVSVTKRGAQPSIPYIKDVN